MNREVLKNAVTLIKDLALKQAQQSLHPFTGNKIAMFVSSHQNLNPVLEKFKVTGRLNTELPRYIILQYEEHSKCPFNNIIKSYSLLCRGYNILNEVQSRSVLYSDVDVRQLIKALHENKVMLVEPHTIFIKIEDIKPWEFIRTRYSSHSFVINQPHLHGIGINFSHVGMQSDELSATVRAIGMICVAQDTLYNVTKMYEDSQNARMKNLKMAIKIPLALIAAIYSIGNFIEYSK